SPMKMQSVEAPQGPIAISSVSTGLNLSIFTIFVPPPARSIAKNRPLSPESLMRYVRFGIRREMAMPLDSLTTLSRAPARREGGHVHGVRPAVWSKEKNSRRVIMASDY